MRKLFIIASLLFAGAAVQAQDFKPTAGSVTTEFGLNDGVLLSKLILNDENVNNNNNISGGMLRFRYFAKENLAYRIGFGTTIKKETNKFYGPNDEEGTYKSTESGLNLNLGVEKHFAGTNRLSPYVGADLLIGTYKFNEKNTDLNGTIYTSGYNTEYKGDGNLSFGLRAVVGADYYIAKHLFLGAEAGLAFNVTKYGKSEFTDNVGTTTKTKSPGSNSILDQGIAAALRIGFVF